MNLICRVFGHNYEWGMVWYPWGVMDYYDFKNPICKRCGKRDYTRVTTVQGASNPK